MSIILPVVLKPNWAYFYALMVVLAGQGYPNASLEPSVCVRSVRSSKISLFKAIYFIFPLCISMFECLDQTDFIHFCNYTLNLCLKFIRINKPLFVRVQWTVPVDRTLNVRFRLERLYFGVYLFRTG